MGTLRWYCQSLNDTVAPRLPQFQNRRSDMPWCSPRRSQHGSTILWLDLKVDAVMHAALRAMGYPRCDTEP